MRLKLWRVAGVLLPGLYWCGCNPIGDSRTDEQKNPYYITGKERVSSRDYKAAIDAFEKALELDPRSALAHFELGVLCEQREFDYPAAIYHYNQVLKLRPSGEYPADHARLRIPACKQEMIKADTLMTINPAALQELVRLREDNQQLRKQIESLQLQLQSRLAAPPRPTPASGQPGQTPPTGPRAGSLPWRTAQTASSRNPPPPTARPPTLQGNASATTAFRTHKVKPNETLAAIARQYGIKLESLLAANPGLEPRRMKAGQTIKVPAS